LGKVSLPLVGWGCAFADLDLDGDEDIIATHGHLVKDWILVLMRWVVQWKKPEFAAFMEGDFNQPILIYENMGDLQFELISDKNAYPLPLVAARGLAMGDIDADGDLDFFIVDKDDHSVLLENRSRRRGEPLKLYFRGTAANRQGIGAQVKLETTAGDQWRWIELGSSYLSSHEVMAHFGVPEGAEVLQATIAWPGGSEQIVTGLEPGASYLITQGVEAPERLLGLSAPAARPAAETASPEALPADEENLLSEIKLTSRP
jgi:hypothetical protein